MLLIHCCAHGIGSGINLGHDLERCLRVVWFRPYLDMHIKATKAYLHSRMRNRVDQLIQGKGTPPLTLVPAAFAAVHALLLRGA